MQKTLILVRHGHRDTSARLLDNGLSEKGRDQAKAIKKFFLARFAPGDLQGGLWFVSSPKLRCVETLIPVAKALDRTVDQHPLLDEQNMKESSSAMQERVQSFLHEWTHSRIALTVASSHGDWLPMATYHLLGTYIEPRKGSWMEIEWENGRAALRSYIPSFKPFF